MSDTQAELIAILLTSIVMIAWTALVVIIMKDDNDE